ncbi:BCCT family transporter [Corynebacterium epidermidicanis]|uniref:Choline/carnitine/betaine transport n=1 Tax=Corynebacterium epidermidicanis TaxID=1050174 RepID=A0A0G3GQ60_9CORY|nr:BCCT family transporter [Corynebacterium epidermidicanis]AKK02690.1 choline/carnitine/betaine transport [Corynebacterium epidermidicanis]
MTSPQNNRSAHAELATVLDNEEHLDPSVLRQDIDYAFDDDNAPLNWPVVIAAAGIVLAAILWGLGWPGAMAATATNGLRFVVENFGWAFVLFSTVFVVFVAAIALSRFGSIRLGRDDEEPEFSTPSWIAMMFAAGMGIGLMFYGAAEPLTFYRKGVPGHEEHEVGTAFATTLFHWTLHPWAMYALVGLALAYATFRMGRKQLLSSAFVPLIGQKRADGWLGRIIDILAIVATIFGTACSLGTGALQISAGLSASGIVEDPSMKTTIAIVAVLTLAFLLSAMSGVGKGIQWLSNANMALAALLAIFVFVLGPTVSILNLIPGNIGNYLDNFFAMAGRTAESADGTAGEWLSSWTLFYWVWWMSWSPFVGMFIARISRGRTIREFVIGVLLVPSAVTVVWFSIFGGAAISAEQSGKSIWGDGSAENQLFTLLHQLPGGQIAGIVAMVLLGTFFITSADSASTVMGSMSQNGKLVAKPWLSALWGVLTAVIGLTMLVAGGDDALGNLQSVTIVMASPFLIILVALMFALVKGLAQDPIYKEIKEHQKFQRRLARERRIHREMEARRARGIGRRKAAEAGGAPKRNSRP